MIMEAIKHIESIKAIQSAIKKSEQALMHMRQKGSSTTLLEKRLKVLESD